MNKITTVPEKNRQKQLMLLTKRTEQSNIITVPETRDKIKWNKYGERLNRI